MRSGGTHAISKPTNSVFGGKTVLTSHSQVPWEEIPYQQNQVHRMVAKKTMTKEFQVTVSRCRVQDLLVLLEEADRGLDQATKGPLDPLMLVLEALNLVMGLRQQVYLFGLLNPILCCTHGFLRFLAKEIN
jgi:hypothetical protein